MFVLTRVYCILYYGRILTTVFRLLIILSTDTSSLTTDISSLPDCSEWLECQSRIHTGLISHSTTSNSLIACLKTFEYLKHSENAVEEYEAALQTHLTDMEQSIYSGINQLTLKLVCILELQIELTQKFYLLYSSVRVIATRILHEICLLIGELAIRGTELTLITRLET